MSSGVTQRELQDIDTEFSRLDLLLEICLLSHDIKSLALEVDEPSSQMMTAIQESLSSGKRIVGEELEKLMENIATIRCVLTMDRNNPNAFWFGEAVHFMAIN